MPFNKYGKQLFRNQYKPSADIAASAGYTFLITEAEKESYGPFTQFILNNRSSKALLLVLDGSFGATGTVQNVGKQYTIEPYSVVELQKDDGILFYRAFVKNLNTTTAIDIATTATEYVLFDVGNETD